MSDQPPYCQSIWIIGPECAGKTTLGRLLVGRLRARGWQALLLDGEEVRALCDRKMGYNAASRRKQTARVVRMVRWAVRQQVLPVVIIIHPFEDDRTGCRRELPGYFETHLACAIDERIARDRKDLYRPALRGEKVNVVDVDIPFDPPCNPDLVIDTGHASPREALAILWGRIAPRLKPQVRSTDEEEDDP